MRPGRERAMIVLRWVAAAAVLMFFLYWSALFASLLGWSFRPASPRRLAEAPTVPLIAVLSGLAGVAGARAVLRRPVLSWWLLLALPVPAWFTLDAIGWL